MLIDILRFVETADLSEQEKQALRKTLEDRLKELTAATKQINAALASLKKGKAKTAKASKRKAKKRP
jgi:hypothetical protein